MASRRALLRSEWRAFRRPGRLIALAAGALAIVGSGLLAATGSRSSCEGPCEDAPTVATGPVVEDQFFFLHRDLGPNGSLTVRLTSMTGTITYPPPNHDTIVSGLVPWAKTGIIVKDGTQRGSAYAALMMTGSHGVRMQHGYQHDVAGMPGRAVDVTERSPRWLRLTRSGDTIIGYESADGERWAQVGSATLDGLPEIVQVGLFATSPDDLTLRRTGLGGAIEDWRFTQATGVFDRITIEGGASDGWRAEAIGEMNHTDWERDHPSGVVQTRDTVTVSGTGDIGPSTTHGGRAVQGAVPGLVVALVINIVVAVRFSAQRRRTAAGTVARQTLLADAAIVATAALGVCLIALAATIPASVWLLDRNGVPGEAIPTLTALRVILGVAAAVALTATLAAALGGILRRSTAAILLAVTVVVVPYAVTSLPLLPDDLADWLLRLTPAAGFAAQQTRVERYYVVAHYAPSDGYHPLPAWAGMAVLAAYALTALCASALRPPHHQPMPVQQSVA